MSDIQPEVKRVPIILSSHGVALLTLFKLPHANLDDLWAWDWLAEECQTGHVRSAKQFIDAMEGHWSPAFLKALRDQITSTLEQHDKEVADMLSRQSK